MGEKYKYNLIITQKLLIKINNSINIKEVIKKDLNNIIKLDFLFRIDLKFPKKILIKYIFNKIKNNNFIESNLLKIVDKVK
jgi:hypothetical protein